jgi:hypothetical protein
MIYFCLHPPCKYVPTPLTNAVLKDLFLFKNYGDSVVLIIYKEMSSDTKEKK